jgi:glycerol-3-phosphate dehydrogenase
LSEHHSAPGDGITESAQVFDLAIIGGGINGCGIARDAAGRGLSVYLCEMNDLASGTSSWSTKLIHGGLRYLEYYEFRLVHEALMERELLWAAAPHIIHPLRFVLPHHRGLRPAWLLRLGLFLYDHIGGRRKLPATVTLDLTSDITGKPLKRGLFARGFEYSDCRVDDARLVVLNAQDAAARGATIRTRTRATSAERLADRWRITTQNSTSGEVSQIEARVLVNAAGPWVADVLSSKLRANAQAKVRLVQGSHIIVRKIFDHDRAYIFQNTDGRIIFAIPYEQDFTLIGTTDRDYDGDPAKVVATTEEIAYLCGAVSAYFENPITVEDVVHTYSGVRPLYDDGASEAKAATRDYVFEVDETEGKAPLLSIFGGKITTYRRLSQAVLKRLANLLPHAASVNSEWTGSASLPGGDFPVDGLAGLAKQIGLSLPGIPLQQAERLARTYGTRALRLANYLAKDGTLGHSYVAELSEAELRYLMAEEWAQTAEDVLWRRTKLGLYATFEDVKTLEQVMRAATAANAETAR